MKKSQLKRFTCMTVLLGVGAPALAQDSVSVTPGAGDALPIYDVDSTSRFVVDLVSLTSSWNNAYRIAPILKACADDDPLFTTQLLGSATISPDQLTGVVFASTDYKLWSTPGAGINPLRNSAPGTLSKTGFSRQFGVAFSDFASVATNAVGALVGQDASDLSRLYVTRIHALESRPSSSDDNTATLSLGAIDANGNLYLRADSFGCAGPKVLGENVVIVQLPLRDLFLNTIYDGGAGSNIAAQVASTSFIINNGSATTNTPTVLPKSLGPAALGLALDFSNKYRINGAAGITTHLASGIGAHRGNPSFSTINAFGGVGTVSSLARTTLGTRTDSLNLFAVDSAGVPVATRGATLPTNITDGAGFTANAASNAEFLQYLSQTTFRGANGQVALGVDPLTSTTIAAAVATDPTQGEFIAVARFSGSPTTWTVAAYEGKSVLNGPAGSPIGAIANVSPVSFSAPGADLLGNIYFVAAYQPTVGPLTTALIKAVNTVSGYKLELLVKAGDAFNGANSGRQYTIQKLTLGDSDSVASGALHSSSVLQPRVPGASGSDPASPLAFGGLIVNAAISYNNNGTPEPYQAVLFVGPGGVVVPPFCVGNANGDGVVNFADVTAVLVNFGAVYTPGSAGIGDANNDGVVNFADVTAVLVNFGATCT